MEVIAISQGLWITGKVIYLTHEYRFEAKVYKEPSQHGINGGKVSKLWAASETGRTIYNWDRGPDSDTGKIVPIFIPDLVDYLEKI